MPDVEVPAFTTDVELFAYTHRMLREASDAELEAYLRRVLPDHLLEADGRVPTAAGKSMVDKIMAEARGKAVTYADAYTADPELKHYQGGQVQWFTALKPIHPTTTRMTATLGGGTMRNGKMSGQEMRLGVVEMYVSDEPEHVQWLKSFDSPEALAALSDGKRSLSDLVAERAPAAPVAAAPAEWSTFESEAAGYSVELPGEPELVEELANGKYPAHTASVEAEGCMVTVNVILYPFEIAEEQARAAVDASGAGYAEAIDAKLLGATDWDLGGHYGRRFMIRHPSVPVAYACAVKGNALYTVKVAGEEAALTSAMANRVLSSFRAP